MSIFSRPQPISNAVLSFERKMLLKRISEVTDLPIPNIHLLSLIRLMREENVSVKELITAIQRDQTLVAKILRLVNSGFYGLKNKVESVDMAVTLLGLTKVKQVVYSASVMDLFSDEERLEWDHAYSSSVLMDNIVKNNDLGVSGELTLAMLLHDIGKVVLRRFSPQKYKMAKIIAQNEHKPLFKAEESVLQISHAEAGYVMMEKWEMDENLIIPVMYHHMETVPPDHVVETALVQFVNWIDCMAREISCPAPTAALLNAAGFENMEKVEYMNFQVKLIRQLESDEERMKRRYGLS